MATSSSGTITTTTVNGVTRIAGLSSGVDVDSIVEQTMTAEKTKLNKLKQQKQLAEWRQEQYRTVIDEANEFANKYFSISSSSSLMLQKTFQQYAVSSTDESAVTAKASSAAVAGSHTISVSQLATAATRTGSSNLAKDVQGSEAPDYSSLSGTSFTMTLDGTDYTVELDAVTDLDSLQTAIDDAVGEGKITVSTLDSGVLAITAADEGVQAISVSAPSDSAASSGLESLGFGTDAVTSNRLSTSDTLETLAEQLNTTLTFDADGQVALTINGVDFTFDKSDTLSEVISEINSSDAGATMKYDSVSGKLVLTSDQLGAGKLLTVSETGSNFLAVALDEATAGKDAKLSIDGQSMTRTSNSVTVDGVTYTLNATTAEDVTIGITRDTDAIYDSIKSFVDDYNTLIDTLNGKISEEYDRDYPPLTEDQEEEMSDTEIENWNEQAQAGLLANDSIIQGLLDDMRSALMSSVSGSSLTLAEIGITTGTYDEKGKLYIDEDTLQSALDDSPEEVMNLFTQKSTSYSGTTTVRTLSSSERTTRYNEEGLAYRLYDVLQDSIGTVRDSSGNKGLLLEKAGMEEDASESDNSLSDLIDDYDERIDAEEDRLDDKEDALYEKYTNMETYLNNLSTQLASLSSYTSS